MIGLFLLWLGLVGFAPPSIHNAQADSLVPASPTDLAALLRTRKISVVELTRRYLERWKNDATGPRMTFLAAESLALRQAARADKELRSGRLRSPFHGVPFAMESVLSFKGDRLEGAPGTEIPPGEITVLRRLEEAGAVFVGWLERGKASAAVSEGLVPFAIASDGWAPIASPPFAASITALLPSRGRVSLAGCTALRWEGGARLGAICTSPRECDMVLRLIAGPDGIDTALAKIPPKFHGRKGSRPITIGLAGTNPDLLRLLRRLGVKIVPVPTPESPGQMDQVMGTCDFLIAISRGGSPRTSISIPYPSAFAGGIGRFDPAATLSVTGRMYEEDRLLRLLDAIRKAASTQRPTRTVPFPDAE